MKGQRKDYKVSGFSEEVESARTMCLSVYQQIHSTPLSECEMHVYVFSMNKQQLYVL